MHSDNRRPHNRTTLLGVMIAMMISGCSTTSEKGVLELASPLPEGTVPRSGALIVSFSRGVVPPDSVNVWTGTPFIEFTPAIPGKFVWQDTSRLVFSPDSPLPGRSMAG
jgi:hypothetical protein